jgi:hypothetical protein
LPKLSTLEHRRQRAALLRSANGQIFAPAASARRRLLGVAAVAATMSLVALAAATLVPDAGRANPSPHALAEQGVREPNHPGERPGTPLASTAVPVASASPDDSPPVPAENRARSQGTAAPGTSGRGARGTRAEGAPVAPAARPVPLPAIRDDVVPAAAEIAGHSGGVASLPGSEAPAEDATREFVRAMSAFSAGAYVEADEGLRAFAIRHAKDPRCEDALYVRTVIAERRRDHAAAAAHARAYLRHFPNGFRKRELEPIAMDR